MGAAAFALLGDVLPAIGADAAGAIGLAALYRGMAVGAMGIVAPISAAAPVVPLAFAHGESPSALQWLGVVVVLWGIALLAREPGVRLEAGLAAGVRSRCSRRRASGCSSSVSMRRRMAGCHGRSSRLGAPRPPRRRAGALARSRGRTIEAAPPDGGRCRPLRPAANVCVAFATTRGSIGIVAVLSALYPLVTIVLARLVLRERLDGARRVGGVLALCGAACVAAG